MVSNGMLLVGSLLAVTCVVVTSATTCNEAQCASLVTKCMLLKSCECDMSDKKNCPCCKDCHRCLSQLYTECCSCVGESLFFYLRFPQRRRQDFLSVSFSWSSFAMQCF